MTNHHHHYYYYYYYYYYCYYYYYYYYSPSTAFEDLFVDPFNGHIEEHQGSKEEVEEELAYTPERVATVLFGEEEVVDTTTTTTTTTTATSTAMWPSLFSW